MIGYFFSAQLLMLVLTISYVFDALYIFGNLDNIFTGFFDD